MRMVLLSTLIILAFFNMFVLWPMVMFFTGWTGHWVMVTIQFVLVALMVWIANGPN